jgi:hypothetical protein
MLDRRAFMIGLVVAPAGARLALATPGMTVFKDPNCGCCDAWVDHVRAAGLAALVRSEVRMDMVKARLGVPSDLVACHTALIDGYVVEGHVPVETIVTVLRERPRLSGIAVPGMPIGSPGMEIPGRAPEPFDVVGFAADGTRRVVAAYPGGYRR